MNEQIHLTFTITAEFSGQRLDLVLSRLLPDYSRSLIQKWIENKQVFLNKKHTRPKQHLKEGDQLQVNTTIISAFDIEPMKLDLDIVYEDQDILVINKTVGLVVHPGAGNPTGTILNGLLYLYPNSKIIPRAGILHRLDKDTSGLMVIAKTLKSYYQLIEDIKDRNVKREYETICQGIIKLPGEINAPIGRHPKNRVKMSVTPKGKPAITKFNVLENFNNFTWLRLQLITGRTHQIRVHLAHISHPIVGDQTYGGKNRQYKSNAINTAINKMLRQALHAKKLSFLHPISKKSLSFETDLPNDMQNLIQQLKKCNISL